MPTQLIEFEAPSGMTLTAKLFVGGSDTVSYTASSVVEQTNRKGIYQATFANVAANNYQLIATSGANAVAAWWGYAADTASTFQFGSISGAIGRESIDANALAASAATEIAAAVNAGLSGSAVQLISPVTDTGTLVVFNGRTYGGAAQFFHCIHSGKELHVGDLC